MPSAVIENAEAAALPSQESLDRLPLAQAGGWRSKTRMLRKLVLTAAVWALYVPHLAILKFLGPRFGPIWARGMARVHWLLTFVGAQRSVRGILHELHPNFETQLCVPAIVRKHLELKHECFARFKLFNRRQQSGGDSGLIWEVDPEMTATFDRAGSSPNGLIILGYHFGFFRLSASAIPQIFPSCNAVYVSNRTAHYAGDTMDAVADMALETALWADQQTGARMHYLEPERSVVRLYRMLLAGETVALAADGALGKDFLDVPFLNGKLRLPCGWARLAAATGARVLVLVDTQIDHRRRRAWIFDHVQIDDNSTTAIYHAVAESARILERFVRREPWAWHPWQRLQFEIAEDGSRVLVIRELGRDRGTCSGSARLESEQQKALNGYEAQSRHCVATAPTLTDSGH
jgi:hypothetical protein